jgi:hypothetical protein
VLKESLTGPTLLEMSGKRCDQACGLLPRVPRHWATIPRGQPMYCAFASRLLILESASLQGQRKSSYAHEPRTHLERGVGPLHPLS